MVVKRYDVEWEDHVIGLTAREARDLVYLARKGRNAMGDPENLDLDVEELADTIPR